MESVDGDQCGPSQAALKAGGIAALDQLAYGPLMCEQLTSEQPPPQRFKTGTLHYYELRHQDFERRNPGKKAPAYYREYGSKYAHLFTEELTPMLSDLGRQWIVKTRKLLQDTFEEKIATDAHGFASLELDGNALEAFAFDSHPKAYLDGGLRTVPNHDLPEILKTVEERDALTIKSLIQGSKTAVGLVPQWIQDEIDGPIHDWQVETADVIGEAGRRLIGHR
jgi:hypothetical protein